MKKNNILVLSSIAILLGASAFTFALSNTSKVKKVASASTPDVGEYTSINVVNCADYIYIKDVENGYEEEDLVDQFVDYAENNPNSPFYGKHVSVSYSTSDTPESMYNEVKTGKTRIDLICPSDYMIQKMLGEGMLEEIDRDFVPNYRDYCSPTISSFLDNIEATLPSGEVKKLEDYCVGYMWGTLGILFNPTFNNYKIEIENADQLSEEELEAAKEEQIIFDLRHYSALWDKQYDGTISIKNSIRDTLAVVDMKHHEEQLLSFREDYVNGLIDKDEYNSRINEIFNLYSNPADSDKEYKFDSGTREAIYKELIELKGNIFGLEVDSGKNDIVTGKIGINLAWSGDAVYAMSQAYDYDETTLYYSVPEEGANIWFDGWVMPKNNNRTADQKLLAQEFLNFISDPENAKKNMDYIGYTSFIAGEDILGLIREWYDYRTSEMYTTHVYTDTDEKGKEVEVEEEVTILVKDGEEYRELDYSDFLTDSHNDALDDEELMYEFDDELYNVLNEDETHKTYADLTIVDSDDSELFEVDLSYFFDGTLPTDKYQASDMIFYAEDYYVDCDDEHPDGLAVGGDFYCQYPDEETIIRCCIMQDFGENNKYILELWEDFKSGEFPTWAIILFIAEVLAAAGVAIYFVSKRKISKNQRKKRKLEAKNS
ncbi:MAG: extracellular solute-binding protein [Bacilli bacterium]|nr:extracellular solute-binding protein [Bacilli bacterium]